MSRRVWLLIGLPLVISLLVTACGSSATAEPAVEVTVAEEVTEEVAEAPTSEPAAEEPTVSPTKEPLNVMILEGDVTIGEDDLIEEGNVVTIGEEDVITTDKTGSARLTHPEDEDLSVEVYPETRLRVMDVESDYLRLFLEVGSIVSAVEPGGVRLVVSGEAGDCEAAGTQWGNDVDELGYMTTTVEKGQVVVTLSDGTSVTMPEGSQLVASSDPDAPPASKFIYFDVSLDGEEGQEESDSTSGQYSDMADELESAGYTLMEGVNLAYVVNVKNPSPYKTLVILDPEKSLDAEEIDAIQTWVAQGRSLFIIGEQAEAFDRSSINQLLSPYGITFTGEKIGDAVTDSFDPDHPVTQGIERLQLDGCGALEVDDDAIPLGYTESGHVMLAAFETDGDGRILVMADSGILSDEHWGDYDAGEFTNQAFDWLAHH